MGIVRNHAKQKEILTKDSPPPQAYNTYPIAPSPQNCIELTKNKFQTKKKTKTNLEFILFRREICSNFIHDRLQGGLQFGF